MKRFDVLVIGSGMGGMCAAARLAHEGYHVLVIESLAQIGGRCSTRWHQGFRLATGVVAIERGGIVEDFFRELRIPFPIRPSDDFCYLLDGRRIAVAPRRGMKHLLSAAGGDMLAISRIMAAIARGRQWQPPSSDISLKQWLAQYTRDRRLEDVFETLVAAPLMVGMEEISAAAFFHFIEHLNRVPRFGYAPEGPMALPAALEAHILKHHGEVWTRAEAKRIRIEKGTARGALVHHLGKEEVVEASAVISNVGPRLTARLVGEEHLDRDDLHILETVLRPARCICLQMASAHTVSDHPHLWVIGGRRIRRIDQPTAVCPELAPDGRHLVVILASVPWASASIDLDREMAHCRDDMERLLPGFWSQAELLAADAYYGDQPAMHASPGRDAPVRTSIINLYNVGDGVKSPGLAGLPAAVDAAERCAADVCRRINLIKSTAAAP